MSNGTRFAALGGVVVAGVLALSACGTDENTSPSSGGGAAAGSGNCVKATVNAAGSSAQANAVTEWIKGYQSGCAGANLNYNPSGSGAGVQSFISGQVAFAGSDSALKPDEVTPAKQRCQGNNALNLPMVVGPVAVAYNLRGLSDLQLSPTTIANIFSGKITKWNDPAIKKDNPNATLPDTAVKSVHRSDESGTTDNFTSFLAATAPDVWKFEPGKKWTAPGGQGGTKSDGVTTVIKQTDGAIGYIEMSYATQAKLNTAKVANGSGEFVALSTDSASKALEGAEITGTGNDLSMKIDYATKTAGAYPIVLVTYEIVCEKGLPSEQSQFVKSFLTYTSSSAGQNVLAGLGYAPLPPAVLTKVQNAVKALA
ncbi:MAG TPA: phosphate ABC transporter substrate-binding protein PstS [Streptosporangiaceae bacterium]|nr:phosphate ABC transporter substrate-binding protein PstS [Streptosporangiaceae bacterium]